MNLALYSLSCDPRLHCLAPADRSRCLGLELVLPPKPKVVRLLCGFPTRGPPPKDCKGWAEGWRSSMCVGRLAKIRLTFRWSTFRSQKSTWRNWSDTQTCPQIGSLSHSIFLTSRLGVARVTSQSPSLHVDRLLGPVLRGIPEVIQLQLRVLPAQVQTFLLRLSKSCLL